MTDGNILKHAHHHKMDESDVYGAYKIFFGTLVSESRLKIINLLRKKERNVGEIVDELGMDQTAVSHDLARMKRCGFVKARIEGKFRVYALSGDIREIMKLIDEHMDQYCVHILHGEENGK